jgi:hypothetical protein
MHHIGQISQRIYKTACPVNLKSITMAVLLVTATNVTA